MRNKRIRIKQIEIPIKVSGVYCLKNEVNKKIYVGSSEDCRERAGSHFSLLKFGKHHNKHLQNSFNQYGVENFRAFLIEEVKDLSTLRVREQYWIDFYRSYDSEVGYNMARYAENSLLGSIPWNKGLWKLRVSEQQLISEYLSGFKIKELTVKYNLAPLTVGKVLHTAGVTRPSSGRPKGRECSSKLIDKIEKFYKHKHTIRDTAKKFDMPNSTIRIYLNDRGCLRDNHIVIHPRVKVN